MKRKVNLYEREKKQFNKDIPTFYEQELGILII